MKRLLLWLLIASPTLTIGQTPTITGVPSLTDFKALQADHKAFKDSVNKAFKALTGVVVVSPPVATLKDCKKAPTIVSISKITSTGAELKFDADSVFKIKYWISIQQNGPPVYTDSLVNLTSNTISFKYPVLSNGSYYLNIQGLSCRSDVDDRKFTITNATGEVVTPPVVVPPTPIQQASHGLGTYETVANGRHFVYNRTGEFSLSYVDGKLTDNTPGLDKSGEIWKLGGQNVYYAIGQYPLRAENGKGQNIQDVYLPDGIYTVGQYICNPSKIPNFEAFVSGFEGYTSVGVNADNARYSKIYVSIHSDIKQGNGSVPSWLIASRKLESTPYLIKKDWRPYYKFNGLGITNRDDTREVYKDAGYNTYFSSSTSEKKSWRTDKLSGYPAVTPSREEFYSMGIGNAIVLGNDLDAHLSDEHEENTAGKGGDIYSRQSSYYKGFFDQISKSTGSTDVRKMGAIGGYGSDQYYNVFGAGLDKGFERFKESLTTFLYNHYSPVPDQWGFTAQYFTSGAINYRNLNWKSYFYNVTYQNPYLFLYLNERVKLSTKTFEGKDRERNLIYFTSPNIESFVADFTGGVERRNWIEANDSGEIIPFPGGEILANTNNQPPAAWDEMYNSCLWANFLLGGADNWAVDSRLGSDSTKLDISPVNGIEANGLQARWKADGLNWVQYASGRIGAPERSLTGMNHRLYAAPQDAHIAAAEVVWQHRDKIQNISHVAYTSTRDSYTPVPGTAGLNLNGYGPLNWNQYNAYYIYAGKKAIALESSGSGGRLIWYYNGFLSPHLYEDVTINGKTFRAYGRQTVITTVF